MFRVASFRFGRTRSTPDRQPAHTVRFTLTCSAILTAALISVPSPQGTQSSNATRTQTGSSIGGSIACPGPVNGAEIPPLAMFPPPGLNRNVQGPLGSMDDAQRAVLGVGCQHWMAQGPAPITNGQVENISASNDVAGSINVVVAHPTNANLLYIGATNGGVWKTTNALAVVPDWTPLTDGFPSLSIGALDMDPANPDVLVAGNGRFSGLARFGGALDGLLVTTDGGANWTQLRDPLLIDRNISGIAKRGLTIVVGADDGSIGAGLYRSIDGGTTWTFVSGTGGLTAGPVFDLVGDPLVPTRLYASVKRIGIFLSNDTGATWTNVSQNDPAGLGAAITSAQNSNAQMSVARTSGRVFVMVVNAGRAAYIGFSPNLGVSWTRMDLPRTLESNGDTEGLHPAGQGLLFASILADPTNANLVYVGGDFQDGPFPNFIGATKLSGRSFRGDTTVAPTNGVPSPQWAHLTHRNDIAAIPLGGTSNSSAPHGNSHAMTFAANGDLIETDEGGIYRRTVPQNRTGRWFSLNGDLQVAEIHDLGYDSVSGVLVGATQGTGTAEQSAPASTSWRTVSGGDGGDVAIDTWSLPGMSIRYTSGPLFLVPVRRVVDAANNVLTTQVLQLDEGAGPPFVPRFITPVEVNVIDGRRIVIAGLNGVYESLDRGDHITFLGVPLASVLAYGGKIGGVVNPDLLYAAASADVFVRTTAAGPLAPTAAPFPGGTIFDLEIDPDDWRSVYVAGVSRIFRSIDAGASWQELTGSLAKQCAINFRSIEFIPRASGDGLALGTAREVFVGTFDGPLFWHRLGASLPNAPVFDLDYDPTDDVLAAGTLGRGAFLLERASIFACPMDRFLPSRAEIELDRDRGDQRFEVRGNLTLATGSDGINPPKEDLRVEFAGLVFVVPAGTFRRNLPNTGWRFGEGRLPGIKSTRILDTGQFRLRGRDLDLSFLSMPAPVMLKFQIGNDAGEMMIPFDFEGEFGN